MNRCPVCRVRLKGETVCRRCRTDLVTLRRIYDQADALECISVHALAAGRLEEARDCARRAMSLRSTSFVRCLVGFIQQLLSGL